MAYNSSGVFSRVHDFTDDRDNGIRIQASRMDAEMDGIATGLSTAITKDGTQTTTAIIPFAVGLSIIDNQSAIFGTTSDYTLQYDEATRDSLMLTSNVEGAAFKLTLAADQGDDASDEWQVGINTSGVLSIGNDIASAQTYVSQLTLTPHATVASSTTAVLGNLTVGGDLTVTGDDITMATNTAGHVLVGDGTNYNPVAISGDVTLASSGAITIASGSVETAMIAADAITSAKIADDAINSEHYTDGSIDTAHIANSQITVAKMAANSVDSDQYVDGSIDTAHIANLQITTGLIAADAITADKIADDVVNSEHYAAGSIDTEHIADSQVTVAKMADNSIDSDQYVDGSIDTAHISDNAVTLAKMAGIARGKFIIGDASGNPAVIGPGTNAQVLTSDGTDIAFADAPGATALAADNLTIGDAAILLTTSSGNITIDAAANDSDIIFKGTDGGADTTYLTIDGSAAGAATFNDKIIATSATLSGDLTASSLNGGQFGGRRNIIINGAMKVAQRSASVTGLGAATGYFTLDRYRLDCSATAGRLTMAQVAVTDLSGFANAMKLTCTTADTSIAAGEILGIRQFFEGQDVQQLKKGTSDAEKFTVSFFVKGNANATYTCEISDTDNTRIIAQEFSVTSSWNRVVLTFDGDTTGVYDDDNARSMDFSIFLHAGSSFTGGTFSSNTYHATDNQRIGDNQTSFFDSTDRTFFFTGLQIEVGSVATPFEHRSFGEELALCNRYFNSSYNYGTAIGSNVDLVTPIGHMSRGGSHNPLGQYFQPTPMRTTPTVVIYNPVTGTVNQLRADSANVAGAAVLNGNEKGTTFFINGVSTTNTAFIRIAATFDSEL